MDGQRILTLVLVLLIVAWMAQLVWLYRAAENQRADPIRTVSGAAIFFFLAAPVAISRPGWVDGMAGLWEKIIPSGGGGQTATHAPARLLIDGATRPIDQARLRLGRYPNNEIVLDHTTVSAYHAEIIERPDGRHEIIDRESRNGTRVNGALIRNQVLRDGDLITLGAASIHYLGEAAGAVQPGPTAAADPYGSSTVTYEDDDDYYDDPPR